MTIFIVVFDDATSELCYARPVHEESKQTVLAALKQRRNKKASSALYTPIEPLIWSIHRWLNPSGSGLSDSDRTRLGAVGH